MERVSTEEIALCVRLHLTELSSYSVSSRILIGRFTVYVRFICSKKQNEPEIVPILQNVVVQIKSWEMPPILLLSTFLRICPQLLNSIRGLTIVLPYCVVHGGYNFFSLGIVLHVLFHTS